MSARAFSSAARALLATVLFAMSTLPSANAHAEDSGVKLVRHDIDVLELPPWSFRLGVAGGVPVPSLHERILAEEGYSGPRWAFMVSAERRVHGHLGIGLLGVYALRSIDASLREDATSVVGPSPTYSERSWLGAVELPITFLLGHPRNTFSTELCLVPWVGVGAGTLDLYERAGWQAGPAFGGELRLLWRGRRVVGGLGVGGYSLRVDTPGAISDPVDLGMFFFSAVGGFDVG